MPSRTSDSDKRLRGTYRKDRAKKGRPRPDIGRPEPLDSWAADSPARAMWDQVAPELTRIGLLTEIDQVLIWTYCESWEAWLDAQRHLADEGPLYTTSRGVRRPSPWLKVQDGAFKKMLAVAGEFGLTPRARQRLDAVLPPESDDQESNPFRLLGRDNPWNKLRRDNENGQPAS